MSIQKVKNTADEKAKHSASECRMSLASNPLTAVAAGNVKDPTKFFRKMAGLRNGDLKAEAA